MGVTALVGLAYMYFLHAVPLHSPTHTAIIIPQTRLLWTFNSQYVCIIRIHSVVFGLESPTKGGLCFESAWAPTFSISVWFQINERSE